MAWRDARSNKKRLFVYISAIIIGVAAQVAITSFRANLEQTIQNQSKELLGADLEVETNQPPSNTLSKIMNGFGEERSTVTQFPSMALFPKNGRTRLSNIRAVNGGFPFYGALETIPKSTASSFQQNSTALVDQSLLTQFDISAGDSVRIGNVTFAIGGAITSVPGEAAAASLIGPRIFIPSSKLSQTNLIQPGSRVSYKHYFKFSSRQALSAATAKVDSLQKRLAQDIDYTTVKDRREDIGKAVGNLGKFLNLVAFIALLLGGIGIASSIHVYINQKIDTASVLRCLGTSSEQTMSIFLIQTTALGFLGALAGTLLGVGTQYLLPSLFSEFLPVSVDLSLSWFSIITGLITGTAVALIFALMPLLALRKLSPLHALRKLEGSISSLLSNKIKISIFAVIAGAVMLYAGILTESWLTGLLFTASMIAVFGLLYLVAKTLMKTIQRFFPSHWSYVWRQGLANLYRPQNQTVTLMLSLGMGILLVSTLYFSQDMLMGELSFANRDEAPNLVLFDIQPDQNSGVNKILRDQNLPVLQNVPMVTMRMDSLRGRSTQAIKKDSTSVVKSWPLEHEYRSTYRDSLVGSEEITKGKWVSEAPKNGSVPVSAAQNVAEDLNLSLGDSLTFDVQGVPVQAYIASVRKVDFQRVQPNFLMLFPTGVLEGAPQIYVTVSRTTSDEATAKIQQSVVEQYPNVSAINVGRILETVNTFLDKISFAVQFMALFSILTGLIVLASSVATGRFQRIKESVLLRTLGASKKQIIQIMSVEYLFLGILSSLTGLILSVGATWLLGYFYFDISYLPNLWVIVVGTAIVTGLTLLIGMVNSRSIYKKTPLEVLRAEVT